MRIILTGGCTGGHIYPALAIGDKFKQMDPECEILYIGHALGLEVNIVPEHGYTLKTVTADWVDRSNFLRMFGTVVSTEKGKLEAYMIMRRFKPDIVISTGSFVSVPVVLAAHKYGAKIYIHEQNAFPGLSNRYLMKYAELGFLGFKSARRHFGRPDKLIYSGNPVRSDFVDRNRTEERAKRDISEDDFVILLFGGSLGAGAINDIGSEVIRAYAGRSGITVVIGAGGDYYTDFKEKLSKDGMLEYNNIHIVDYIKDMPGILAASNIVICRSGALSIAEITMSGRAAIFVPSPNVTGDHQYYNAKEVVDAGGAIIVREDEDAAERVINTLNALIAEPETVEEMENASRLLAPAQATNIIYKNILEDYES